MLTARAAHLEAALDAEGIEAAHVWADSFGATIAEAFARLRPDRARSLVLGAVFPA